MKIYRYLTGPDDFTFCHKVSLALSKGWELHGSPAYSFDAANGAMRCGQAVTKTDGSKTYDPTMTLGEQ